MTHALSDAKYPMPVQVKQKYPKIGFVGKRLTPSIVKEQNKQGFNHLTYSLYNFKFAMTYVNTHVTGCSTKLGRKPYPAEHIRTSAEEMNRCA